MYILLIFNDQECFQLNCIWLYDSFNKIIKDTNKVIKYSDLNKKTRVYKTCKSFFRVLRVNSNDAKLYF